VTKGEKRKWILGDSSFSRAKYQVGEIKEPCKVIKTVFLIAIHRPSSSFRITRYFVAYLNIFYYFRSTAKHTHDFLPDGIALSYH